MSGKRQNIKSLSNDNARDIAVNVLLAFERDKHQIQASLDEIFRIHRLGPRQKHLAGELAYGSCRQMITLDYLIKRHSHRNIRHIDPVVRQILRVGLYQMIYLSGTPDFAAVHEAVDQAKKWGGRGADKFINALLRSVQRDIEGPINQQDQYRIRATLWMDQQTGCQFKTDFLPDPTKNPSKFFSLAYSHPLWLIERWLKRYDQSKVRALCLANNARPCLTLRINNLQCNSSEFTEKLTEANIQSVIKDQAIQLIDRASPDQLPGYNQGWFSVQDITAMNAVKILNPRPGDKVLDLCAAPGGKTTQLAESMNNTGQIVACDVTEDKLERIRDNCRRLGISIVQTHLVQDLPALAQHEDLFDAVLVDAPCSNTGVLARRVEVRHRLKPIHLNRLADLQTDLLNQAAVMIKNGGKILYSSCSIEPAENELLIRKFLQANDSFELVEEKFYFPENQTLIENDHSTPAPDAQKPHYQLWQDGGYTALLHRG